MNPTTGFRYSKLGPAISSTFLADVAGGLARHARRPLRRRRRSLRRPEAGGRAAPAAVPSIEGCARAGLLAARIGRQPRARDRRAAPRFRLPRARHPGPLRRAALARHAGAAVAVHAPDRRRDLGLRLARRQLPTDPHRQSQPSRRTITGCSHQGRFVLAGHADLHQRKLVRAGAGRARRQHQPDTRPNRLPASSPPTTSGSAPASGTPGTSPSDGSRPSTSIPLGMGLDLNTYERLGAFDPPSPGGPNGTTPFRRSTRADYLLYRPARPGNVALHLYPHQSLRIELLGQCGNDGPENSSVCRPGAIFDMGWLKLRGAAEYQYEFARGSCPDDKNTVRRTAAARARPRSSWRRTSSSGVNFGAAVIDVADAQHPHGGRSRFRQPAELRRLRRRRAAPGDVAEPHAGCGRQLRQLSTTCSWTRRRTTTRNRRTRRSTWPPSISSTGSSTSSSSAATPSRTSRTSTPRPLRRRHVQRPRPPDVPLLVGPRRVPLPPLRAIDSRRPVNLLRVVPLRRRNLRCAICRR